MQHCCWICWKQKEIKRRLRLYQLLNLLNRSLLKQKSKKAQSHCRELATQCAVHKSESHKQNTVHKLKKSYNKRILYSHPFHFQKQHWKCLKLWKRSSQVLHCYTISIKINLWGLKWTPLNLQLTEFWHNNLRSTVNCTDYQLCTTARSC